MKILKCFHCGTSFRTERFFIKKSFCSKGCEKIYGTIKKYKLEKFYVLNKNPGINSNKKQTNKFLFLETPKIRKNIIDFENEKIILIRLFIPSIHCSSCIWLLENLSKIYNYIVYSNVDFNRKILRIGFKKKYCKISDLVQSISKLGYEPIINQKTIKNKNNYNRVILYKLSISFFCFGNNMLLSLPEYINNNNDLWLIKNYYFFRYLMLIISIPSLYSSFDYFKSSYKNLINKNISVDILISIGITSLFSRSVYEVLFNIGSGYFDSLCGLIFFLTLGKYFQTRTYNFLSFDQDYKYFYPISVTKIKKNSNIEKNILISELKVNDNILIRNEEIIPADSIIIKGRANIDNSFITGESRLVSKKIGDNIYAGSKNIGSIIIIKIIKNVDQSYLNQLWNNEKFNKKKSYINSIINKISKYFAIIILLLSIITSFYWYYIDISKVFKTFSTILIVACPCALAISMPFTLGNIMKLLSKNGIFIKNMSIIEKISNIKTLIFDKTGTITETKKSKISFIGKKLTKNDQDEISSLLKNSKHPLSILLFKKLNNGINKEVSNFKEFPGMGMIGLIENKNTIKIGSYKYLNIKENKKNKLETKVFVSINKNVIGYFIFRNYYRKYTKYIFNKLKNYDVHILSGDNNNEKQYLKSILTKKSQLLFNQSPKEKLLFIKKIQKIKKNVMMFGDGINDIGALKQSEVGVVIFENSNNFSPYCDVLMNSNIFKNIPSFLILCKKSILIVKINFIISTIYNLIGIGIAIKGDLSPLLAAILMPLSSISVISFSLISTWIIYNKYFYYKNL